MNVCAAHSDWKDTGAWVKGDSAAELLRPRLGAIARRRTLARILMNAQTRIWVTSPYFSPPRWVIRQLQKARHRGVDVRVMLPSWHASDLPWMTVLARAYWANLLRKGVRLFEYLGEPHRGERLHAKTLVVDESAWVGSTNLDHRSLSINREADIVLRSPEAVHAVAHGFEEAQSRAKEVTHRMVGETPLWMRALGWVLLLFRRWL